MLNLYNYDDFDLQRVHTHFKPLPIMTKPNARTIITVDGLAGSGKTTLSKLLAEKLGFIHLNSGSLYRSVAWLVKNAGIAPGDTDAIRALLTQNQLSLVNGGDAPAIVQINGQALSEDLQKPEISELTSILAAKDFVRDYLRDTQRLAFAGEPLVAEGRDMGTIIFPDAPLKFFVTASPEIRAARRIAQLYGDTANWSEDRLNGLKHEMEVEISARDKRDNERALAPTKPAENAVLIDNSREKLTAVVQNMYAAAASQGLLKT